MRTHERDVFSARSHANADHSGAPRRVRVRLERNNSLGLHRLPFKFLKSMVANFSQHWWRQLPYRMAMSGMVLAIGAMALKDWYVAMIATLPAAAYYLVLSLAERYRVK